MARTPDFVRETDALKQSLYRGSPEDIGVDPMPEAMQYTERWATSAGAFRKVPPEIVQDRLTKMATNLYFALEKLADDGNEDDMLVVSFIAHSEVLDG